MPEEQVGPYVPVSGWSTRHELHFLECLWAGELRTPNNAIASRALESLQGYARGFALRKNWGGVEPEVIARWLKNHGFQLPAAA